MGGAGEPAAPLLHRDPEVEQLVAARGGVPDHPAVTLDDEHVDVRRLDLLDPPGRDLVPREGVLVLRERLGEGRHGAGLLERDHDGDVGDGHRP